MSYFCVVSSSYFVVSCRILSYNSNDAYCRSESMLEGDNPSMRDSNLLLHISIVPDFRLTNFLTLVIVPSYAHLKFFKICVII